MKPILLKLSGELFNETKNGKGTGCIDVEHAHELIKQIKELTTTNHISIVVGGGNFFRGAKEGSQLGLRPAVADQVGMMATVMNGIILQELFTQLHVPCVLMSAVRVPGLAHLIEQTAIDRAQKEGKVIIFAGGTGNPCFSTDTNAMIRAVQVGAKMVLKATKVDGVYDSDPILNSNAKRLTKISYQYALDNKLQVMDLTAIVLAQQHGITLRIFSLYEDNALVRVIKHDDFGSTIE
jgi:uridylate kinase